MPFTPDSKVYLLNVPLDNTYKNQLFFNNVFDQNSYFVGRIRHSYVGLTYKRKDNVIQIDAHIDTLYDSNYVMYQNSNFTGKWFYAFITKMEYKSDNTTWVYIETDVWQTWISEKNLLNSFIVREMADDDSIGANLTEEGLDTGEYVSNGVEHFDYSSQKVCILSSKTYNDLSTASGTTINGVYTGLDNIAGIDATDYTSINAILKKFIDAGKEDAIVAVYQYPSFCGDASTTSPVTETKNVSANQVTIDGYTPKNKKLFTHPFNFMVMSNNQGKTITYRYENFIDINNIQFEVDGVYVTTPVIFCFPMMHRGAIYDYDSGLTLENFPQCAWVGDAFKAWIAQNKGALALSTLSSIGTIAGGAFTGNPLAIGSGVVGVASQLGSVYDHAQVPPTVHGQINTDSLNSGMDRYKFSIYKMSIKAQFAERIDSYFDMYGYKTNKVKIPNISSRPHWNYVQTIDVNIIGSIPDSDMVRLKKMFNDGVTFWKNGDEVGNYALNNH